MTRVKYALDSLAAQSYQDFELIFIDYGSDKETAAETRRLVGTYSFSKYYYYNSTGWYWNRSHALNLGIRKASADVLLIYDIDLIIERDFLQKISLLDHENQFYTFSCFYLPQHFNLANKQLSKDGIHYEQNYVGLCATKRIHVDSIQGFDEYFMVWGGEDDDFYNRLLSFGLQRKQMQAAQYLVFHQWHQTQSPVKPSMWYLTMVNYLSLKNTRAKLAGSQGQFLLKEDRPVLKVIEDNGYEKYTKLEFLAGNRLLFFNSFIQHFHQLPNESIAYLEYKLTPGERESKGFLSRFINKADEQQEQINLKDISHFFEYFIGTNRQLLSDYYLHNTNNKLLFVCLKNELDHQEN